MKIAAMLLLTLAGSSPLLASGPVRRGVSSYHHAARQTATVKTETGLVIVPFAVPVAVPVATVVQPSVLYSYRQYAEPAASGATVAPSSPTPLPQVEKGEAERQRSTEATDAASVLERHCASCHQGSAAQGNVAMFDVAGALVARLPRQAILDAVEQRRMPQPPTAARLTAKELDVLRAWAKPPKDLVY